jgi:hypothetical protein
MLSTKLLWSLPVLLTATIAGVVANADSVETTVVAPVEVKRLDAIVETTTTTIPATTTTTTTLLPPSWTPPTLPPEVPCQEWIQTALDAGWHWDLLPEILTIAHRESRCQNIIEGHPKWNGHDRGPLQINQVWLDEIEAKYGTWEVVNDPYYNFAWAWEMYIWFDANRGCGFDPWYKTYSCK